MQALLKGRIDLGFLYGPVHEEEIELQPVLEGRLWVAVPRDHPVADKQGLALSELAREPFILTRREHEPALHDRYIALCQEAGFVPHVGQWASQIHTILGLVALGLGVFLVPEHIRRIRMEGVVYVPLEEPMPRIPVSAAWRREDGAPVLRKFLEALPEAGKQRAHGTRQ